MTLTDHDAPAGVLGVRGVVPVLAVPHLAVDLPALCRQSLYHSYNIIWDSLLTVPPVRERVVPMVERGARESHPPVLPDIPLMGRELMDMFFRGGMVLLLMVMALFPISCTLRYHHADKQDKTFHDECHTSTVQTLLPNLL